MPNFGKVCRDCKIGKPVESYYWDSWKVSFSKECKNCRKNYYSKTRTRQIEYSKKWNTANPEKKYKNYRKWAKSKKGRGLRNALERERQLGKIKACPKWLSKADRKLMKDFYKNRPEGHHVDHIIPLKGKEVCGLHVPWNLQYLPAVENIKKGNRLK